MHATAVGLLSQTTLCGRWMLLSCCSAAVQGSSLHAASQGATLDNKLSVGHALVTSQHTACQQLIAAQMQCSMLAPGVNQLHAD